MSRGHRDDGRAPPLATQLGVPAARLQTVERPALLERLERGGEPVTLVCAPAGSGKTTLVAAAARRCAEPVAWVSLEPTDDEPARLWGAALTALELAGAAPAGLPAPGREHFMTRLVNALAELPGRVVLVLDDVHVLRSRDCLAQLAFLVLHAPATLRLVLVARSDPPLPLHVLRVRGGLLELRAADLAFTREEADELLRAHGLSLADELVAALHARTEGWAAGLRLAALGLQDHADPEGFVAELAGDDRVVGDYLLAEVLSRQPERRRAFLLRTALVERVCGGLADALTGRRDGAETLAELSRTIGFVIPVDVRGEWFRYHTLFGGLLRARAERELAGEVGDLHARAARWYAARGAGADALRHAVAAGAWPEAAEIVAERWFGLHVRGHGETVRALAGALPREALSAEACAALACLALEAGDDAAAARHCADARAAARELTPARTRRFLETMALAGLAEARARGDLAAADAAAATLLGDAEPAREAVVRRMLGETARWAGEEPRARAELERAAVLAQGDGLGFLAAAALSDLALAIAAEDPPAAAAHAEHALAQALDRAGGAHLAGAHVALALAAFAELRTADAAAHLDRAGAGRRDVALAAAELAAGVRGVLGGPAEGLRVLDDYAATRRRGCAPPHEPAVLAAARARLLVAEGAPDEADAALAPVRGAAWPGVALAHAELLLGRGEPDAAADALTATEAEPGWGPTRAVERDVLRALAHAAAGDAALAGRALERALALAEATRQLRPFVQGGRRMEDLLRDRIRQGTAHRALVGELLDVLADRTPARRCTAPLLEPLSGREEAILRYLPTTLSNREIASELFVTTNTVKTHLRSIYRKLDVARRREAVERARDLRLLTIGSRR